MGNNTFTKEEAAKIIPKGDYCYNIVAIDENGCSKVKHCPFYSWKIINNVEVPWCNFLNKGGTDNGWPEEDWQRIKSHFGDKLDEELPLDLLWDRCKECGVNCDDEAF